MVTRFEQSLGNGVGSSCWWWRWRWGEVTIVSPVEADGDASRGIKGNVAGVLRDWGVLCEEILLRGPEMAYAGLEWRRQSALQVGRGVGGVRRAHGLGQEMHAALAQEHLSDGSGRCHGGVAGPDPRTVTVAVSATACV